MKESTLKEILEAHSSDLKKHFTALLGPVNKELALLREELQTRDIAIAELKKEVTEVKATNEELVNTNKGLEAKLSEFDKFRETTLSFKQLEAKVEDRTNTHLRKTIVIKGFPEKPNDKWADTRNMLSKHVAKAYNMEFKHAYGMFERVLRGGGNGFQDRKKNKRDIYALCYR